MAQAFAEALEKTTLTGEVKLDPEAAVKLDTDGAQVRWIPRAPSVLTLPAPLYGSTLTPS
jgi:hypothetical protein